VAQDGGAISKTGLAKMTVTADAWLGTPSDPRWYVVYTCARHERTVSEGLQRKSVESYLPTYSELRRWSDRRVKIELPLFPCYVFVRIPVGEKRRVLNTPGVVRFVSLGGHPYALPDEEMDALKNVLQCRPARPFPYFSVGKRVRVKNGPLKGLEGVIQRRKGLYRMVLSIDCIAKSVAVDLEAADLDLLPSSTPD
jgi:transcription antitermination factor NusG